MARLENVSVDELESALNTAETKQEAKRLMVAILYKRGPSVPMIAKWYDMRDDTVYNWFDRLEARPIQDAITDDPRSGRPPKMDQKASETFESAVNQPPAESGFDQPAWSSALAQRFLYEGFDIEYSQRHVQRLLKEAGLSHQTPRPPTADEDERQQFWTSIKKFTRTFPERNTQLLQSTRHGKPSAATSTERGFLKVNGFRSRTGRNPPRSSSSAR